MFTAPGLYAHEKKFAIPFVGFASVFFIGARSSATASCSTFFAGFGAENEYVEFTPRLQDAFSPRRLADQAALRAMGLTLNRPPTRPTTRDYPSRCAVDICQCNHAPSLFQYSS